MNKGKVILFFPGFEGGERGYHWFPFPFLYLSPFLEKSGYEVEIIDARVEERWETLLESSLTNALCLGITAMTGRDIKDGIDAARICREDSPQVPIIWGGPHTTALPEQTAESQYVDIAVKGQGEEVLTEIVNRLYHKRDVYDVPGIAYSKDGNTFQNEVSNLIPFDYDIFPAYHLINIEKYRSPNNVAACFASRGCPYNCTFCTTGDKGYSLKKLDQVKKEILFLINDLQFENIFFQDGTYFVNKTKVMELAKWFVESGLNIKWKAKARASSFKDYSHKELALLKESGLVSVFFGLESGSLRVLKNMRKSIKPEDAIQSAVICRNYDIEFYVSFMFATPYETLDDIWDNMKLMRKLREVNPNTQVQNCIYVPLPDTPMFDQAVECEYIPPKKLEEWINLRISSRFEERDDITWIQSDVLNEYARIYNSEFDDYRHLTEKEESGEYTSVFKKSS
jgi:radical SAM superfamily enzyme YgiQ (UPF0313 family)